MHNTNTRRGFTQIAVNKNCHSRVSLSGISTLKRGFTLIELLVVVLIISILAAVAVPQYQVAVKKAELTKYIPLVKAIATAEDAYFLANGEYTTDLTALDIEIPSENCIYSHGTDYGAYSQCGKNQNIRIGVFEGPSNAQGGDNTIRYAYYFANDTSSFKRAKKGEIICLSKGEISRKACKTLGSGEEKEDQSSSWNYYYKLD
ncbi:MAG: prepilin-type N-terminal cleavage/methylation domain-containing protein [Elusimicrobiaceae bacterium]|nr:prepilin-type N-terminal cleavage/methylation domain-containing protein [Elusimicrobiaceae bacterium]